MNQSASVVVGDDLGVVRCMNLPASHNWGDAVVNASDGTMCKEQAIQCMASLLQGDGGSEGSDSDLVAAGRVDGSVTVHQAPSCRTVTAFKGATSSGGGGDGVTAVCWLPRASTERAALLAGHASGQLVLHRHEAEDWSTSNVAQCHAQLQCCDVHAAGQLVAFGGEGSVPCVHDVSTGAYLAF
jgi:hypothetical protein